MKYFEVHKEELRGSVMSGECYADGEFINEADELEVRAIPTGFSVYVYDEGGVREDTEFYPITIDTSAWETDEEKVLEKIKQDFPPTEYQNNEW